MDRYPWNLAAQLEFHIENNEIGEAHEDLDRLFELMLTQGPTRLIFRKYRCVSLLTRCVNGARRGGAAADVARRLHWEAFEKLEACKRWAAIKRFLHDHLDQLAALIDAEQQSNLERFVAWMREDMSQSLDSPRTLNQYARLAGVNRSYLSRRFAAIAGGTFREELRDLRIAEASRLLADTPLKVRAVGRRVGIVDRSQFTALFHRMTGLSPSEFRLRHQSGAAVPPLRGRQAT